MGSILREKDWESKETEIMAVAVSKNFEQVNSKLDGIHDKIEKLPCNGMKQKIRDNTEFRKGYEETRKKERKEKLFTWKMIAGLGSFAGGVAALGAWIGSLL